MWCLAELDRDKPSLGSLEGRIPISSQKDTDSALVTTLDYQRQITLSGFPVVLQKLDHSLRIVNSVLHKKNSWLLTGKRDMVH